MPTAAEGMVSQCVCAYIWIYHSDTVKPGFFRYFCVLDLNIYIYLHICMWGVENFYNASLTTINSCFPNVTSFIELSTTSYQ